MSNPMPQMTSAEAIYGQIDSLRQALNQRIAGQQKFVDRLLLALLADGHILLEGPPGLAKTKAVNALAQLIDCQARRVQFTPDLLPSDLTGTDIYLQQQQRFEFQPGPLFHQLILADEINRAPAKVQAALLEAMAERQVTVAGNSYSLPELFMVLATQNPLEQEGTYPLPEAQLDRFLLKVKIDYPSAEAEREILKLVHSEQLQVSEPSATHVEPIAEQSIFSARQLALQTHVSDALINYIIALVQGTRQPQLYGDDLAGQIDCGASPRGTLALARCARVHAWLRGADFATPQDVQAIAADVLRHRIVLSFAAEAEGHSSDDLIAELLNRVPVS